MTDPIEPAQKHRPNRQRTLFITFACLVFPAVALVSFLPNREKHLLHTRGRFHSWGHLLVFGVVAFIAARTAQSLRSRLLLFLSSLVFGVGIEFGEHLIFHNPLEWKDVLVDAAGVIGGTLIAILTAPDELAAVPE